MTEKEIQILKVEVDAYREERLDRSVVLTIPMKAMVEGGVTYEDLAPRGWCRSETRLTVEKRILF